MGIFSGLFRSRDKPKDSYDSQAEGQLRQPVLQLFLRADSCRQASQRPHGNADHRSLRLRESLVGGDRTTAPARLSIHRQRKRASAEAPAIFFAA